MKIHLLCLLLSVSFLVGCASQRAASQRQRGFTARAAGDLETAADHFQQAAAIDGTDWRSHHYLGQLLLELDQPLDAQLHLEKALVLRASDSQTPQIIDDLAAALYRQRSDEQLLDLLDRATHDYGKPYDYLRQGDYLGRLGHIDAARMAYQKAIRFAEAGDAEPYIAYAAFNQEIGDVPAEIEALRHAYYLAPNNDAVNDRLRHHGLVPGPTVALKPEND